MPPVTEIVWSWALARLPSSKTTAAGTAPPSCTRGARREECGWGKWVIAESNYAMVRSDRGDYGRALYGFQACAGTKNAHSSTAQRDASGIGFGHCPSVHYWTSFHPD